MKRARAIGSAVAISVVAAGLTASPAAAAQPRIYHTIKAANGFAFLDETRGCERTEVFVSSSRAMYAAQPGPVVKQGFTDALVRVTDLCALRAAAGGGPPVVFEAEGRAMVPLTVDARLTRASVEADLPGADGAGNPVTIHLATNWTGTGALEHTSVHNHVLVPGTGVVNANDNNLRREVTARVSVTGADRAASGTAAEASLELVKSMCIEVPRPGVEGFYPCFGFPG
ncbi:hypothetical protein N865_15885 [Intrasporangium oryzae NRRL B-24470]|uniref:Cholesterol esterase n=1 Tax=Intrasporangium oryzae NRRL B-24470 TaxID=1386089 RepID=W9G6H9_9MICO|nr:hypothetical protein [Intrasporangium oryzae]EWT00413.1 hypothetical protein N865_15885 [Intrasporangium oryzae NRRL B-24470]